MKCGRENLPEHCVECGLHRVAKNWNIPNELDGRPIAGLWDRRPILVVGQGPGYKEDLIGRPFVGDAGEFLRAFTERLEVPVIYDVATRCFPGLSEDGQFETNPSASQVKICSSAYLAATIRKYRPGVIVCLGNIPMDAVLGDQSPGSIAKAGKGILRFPDLPDTVVMVTYHPINHIKQRRDLREEYIKVFQQAEQICLEGIPDDKFSYELVMDPEVALDKISRLNYDTVFFDVEGAQSNNNPDKITFWHKGFSLICASFTFVIAPHNYVTMVVAGEALRRDVLEKALRNKVVGAHNISYDAQATWISTGVDIYAISSGIIDTLHECYLTDQSKFDNGLKSVCQRILRVPPWDGEVWSQVDAENERRTKFNSKLRSLNAERKKQGLPPMEKIPIDADFTVVKMEDLARYNAHDTHKDARLYYEWLVDRPVSEQPTDGARQITLRAMHPLARTERRGLPFRTDRMDALKYANERKIAQLTSLMLKQPEVLDAIRMLREDKGYPKSTTDEDLFNVKSPDFFTCLVKATGAEVPERTKSGRMASDKGIIERLAKISRGGGDVERSRADWIWYYFYCIRQARDMISKFIAQFDRYIVEGRAHTNFKLAKVEVPGRAGGADDTGGGATTGRLACIAKGTLVEIPRDPSVNIVGIPIEDVQVGDLVYSYDDNGHLSLRRVLNAAQTGVRETVILNWEDCDATGRSGSLCLTPEHEVRMFDCSWRRADALAPGERIMSIARDHYGASPRNHAVVSVVPGPVVPVYDLTIEGTKCFIANEIAVHNSSNPQCHNIKKDVTLRSCVGYEDDAEFAFVETDYDRIEPVCLTVLSNCMGWKEAFAQGLDLYKAIAVQIPSLGYSDVSQVSKADRNLIKTHTLAVMYDESPESFASSIGISLQEAKDFYEEFYRAFPETRAWKQDVKRQVVRGEMVTTLFGRKKSFELRYPEKDWSHLVDLESLDLDTLSKIEHDNLKILRQACNFPVQSLASDLTLWKLHDLYDWMDENGLEDSCHPVNTVHDAVWFEMRRDKISYAIPQIIDLMERVEGLPFKFDVPLGVTLKVGTNLGYMIEIGKDRIPDFINDPEKYIAWAQAGHPSAPEK